MTTQHLANASTAPPEPIGGTEATTLSVSVVICTYTEARWPDLDRAITSVLAQSTPPDEVVLVVDHCPALQHRAAAEWSHRRIRVVANGDAPGLSGARNTGVEVATGDLVLFLDDDAVADPDWVRFLVADYATPGVLGVGGRARPRWFGDRRPGWFPAEFDWVVGCSYRGLPGDRAPVRNFIGANMSFRRSALTGTRGFRSELGRIGAVPAGCEETELCIRMQDEADHGELLYEPAAEVWHTVPAQRATWSYFRSRCYAEGVSKARVSQLVGTRRGLSAERRYLLVTILTGVLGALGQAARGRPSGVARALAMVLGVGATAFGYAVGRVRTFGAVAAGESAASARRRRAATILRVGAAPVAIGLWLFSLHDIDLTRMDDLGLVPLLPVTFWAALAVLLVSFCVQLRRPDARTPVLAGHVLGLIAILHATPSILYGTLRYSWAWKHVGVTDFFMRHAGVDRSLQELSAYQYWPGFFTTNAMMSKLTGLAGVEGYAIWAAPFFNALLVGPLFLIFSTFTRDRRLIWSAIGIFFLGSWVGQDYFAPQACAYFLFLSIVALCVRYLRPRRSADRAAAPELSVEAARPHLPIALAVVVIGAAIVPTHQLTPIVLISGLAVLAVLCGQRRVLIPLLSLIAVTLAWDLLFAWPWLSQNLAGIESGFGQLGANAASGFINLSTASKGQVLVAEIDRFQSAAVVGLALLGFARRFRTGRASTRRELALPLLALTPVPLLFTSDYDGEMIFRIYLFGLPFAAFYAAAAFFPRDTAGRSWWTRLALPLAVLLLVPGFAFSYYGKEEANYFSPDEVQAAKLVYGVAPQGSLIVGATSDFPWGFTNYEMYDYERFALEDARTREQVLNDPVGAFTDIMSLEKHHHSYLVLTRAQRFDTEMTGIMPPGSLDRVEQALLRSPDFAVLYQSPDAIVITLVGPAPEPSP